MLFRGMKRRNLNRHMGLIVLTVLAISLLFVSCRRINTTNSALESLNLANQNKGTLAVIQNMPDEKTVQKVPKLTTLSYDDTDEALLLIPVLTDSTVEIKNLSWDNNELREAGTAYRVEKTEDGYGLYLKAIRPEGAPVFKIVVTSPQGRGEYILAYDGKDGTRMLETINAE